MRPPPASPAHPDAAPPGPPADLVAAADGAAPMRVLFLCPTNAARSQIAEALLARKGGERFVVASAGVAPAPMVHPGATRALAALGIDWSGRAPRGLDAVAGMEWDAVITTCDRSREWCPTPHGRPAYAHWGVPDPVAAGGATLDQGPVAMSAFSDDPFVVATQLITWRIDLMLALRPELLARAVGDAQLHAVARSVPQGEMIAGR